MALIKCPECGKEVSDKATACIYCGYPMIQAAEQKVAPITDSTITDKKQEEIEKLNTLGDNFRISNKYIEALDCYTETANLGSAHAQLWIGNFYSRGLGVEPNQTEAAKWYQKSAEKGNADAIVNLALLYKNGTGVEKNIDKAIELDLQAIQKGSALAAGNLGSLYEFASDEHQSYSLARKYYEIAISLGTTQYPIYNNLASIYENGRDANVDFAKAEAYYLKAIELGSTQAKENYGIFANNRGVAYAEGNGVCKDYAKAEEYYLKAIKMGNQQAKANYAVFANNRGVEYTDGKGVAKDYSKAEAYYLKAIQYGNQQARSNYEALKKSMAIPQTNATAPATKTSGINGKTIGIIVAIIIILFCWFIGSTGDNSDETNTRTCAWCNGTGYNGNGAQSPEEYVFKKTPCTHCGGDGKY